jgi:LuxR family maltose regulon positive regulatory protein
VEGALDALRDAEQTMQAHHVRLATRIEFSTARVVQWLVLGDVQMAGRWSEECSGGSELEQIALARLCLAQGRAADAYRVLDQQRTLAERGGRTGRLIEVLALQALALEAQGQSDEADANLSRALSLARPEGYVRLFLDLGGPLYALLERSAANAPILGDYVRDLLDASRQEKEAQGRRPAEAAPRTPTLAESLVDPLTDREMEVLQLLAEGLTNKQIAGRLVVAPSTVKQHLKNIYGKLEVHSRTQAVARGRELALL